MREGDIGVYIEEPFQDLVGDDWVESIASAVLEAENVAGQVAMSVAVAGDETVTRLNRQYLGRDEPTDVLAFPFASPGSAFVVPSDGIRRLGDVVVCYPQAARQADELGHSAREETVLLVIHGVLHLLGYDDETPGAAAIMTRRQEELWARLK